MIIVTDSYEAIFNQYSAAMKWMEGLGVKSAPGRTAHYEKIIRHWKDAYKTATADEGRGIFPDFVSSMFEVFDFIKIHQAFEEIPPHKLASIISKLQKGVNGPINAADETPESTSSRNFLFEAAVAARAHRPDKGIAVILGAKSDTGLSLSGRKLWIECKRVTSVNGIEGNTRKATRQLENILSGEVGCGNRGIVALDISKILNAGDKIFVAKTDSELISSVDRIMNKFIEENSHIWERVYSRRHKKIIGTIIKFSFMAVSEERHLLVHTSQWAINPRLNVTASDEQIQVEIVSALAGTQ